MFNPFRDHEDYLKKKPEEMSLQELRMLLKIKRLDLELEWKNFQGEIRFWERVWKTVQRSGILEKLQKPETKEENGGNL